MHIFWEIIVSNSLVVTVLAVVLALLARVWKNPVGLHLLWVLVLLKLVTPPLVILPVPLMVNIQPPAPPQQGARQRVADRSPGAASREDEIASIDRSGQERESDEAAIPRRVAPIEVASAAPDPQGLWWMTVLTWSWVVGIGLFASGQACRILRLRRLLRGALPAPPTILSMAEVIGKRLGLSRTPEVLMVSARLSPMVWSPVGRPHLVLPAALFARLDVAAQEAIVAHELAHIRRRDHWVRLLELTVSTLFWWHPVVWWACRVLRELEEHCCDGMVLGAVPYGGGAYATALVDTLDYLSERSLALPPVATGANALVSLSRRIKMLRNPAAVRPLTVRRLLLLLAVAAVPMAVAFAARTSPADDRPRWGDDKQDQGQDSLLAQADKNQGTGQPAVAKPSGTESPAKGNKNENQQDETGKKKEEGTPMSDKKSKNRPYETWRLTLNLQASKLLPSAVQWALCDQDPVPAFKARIEKMQWIYREQVRRAENEAAREKTRNGWLTRQWDWGFKEIPGDRLYLLTSDHPRPLESNGPDGKKWIVTKVGMAKEKPVCWCIPVELQYGEEIKVTLTDQNVVDLASAAESALPEAAVPSAENKKKEEWLRKTWVIQLNLRVPGSAPFEVPFAIFDEDPVPDFKASVKKVGRLVNEAVGGEARQQALAALWATVFRKITGDHLDQLPSSRSLFCSSNGPDGKKWIVTKVVQIKGQPVCWCLPVEVKTGQEIKVTLTEDNVFDLGAVVDSALRESEPPK